MSRHTQNEPSHHPSQEAVALIKQTAENWPTRWVNRKQAQSMSGHTINARTLANLDSLGRGPDGAFKIGNITCYPIDAFTNFLISRLKDIKEEESS